MNSTAIAMDYARILYSVCEEKKIVEEMLYEIKKFDLIDTKEVDDFLTTPLISKELQIKLVNELKNAGIIKELLNLIKILLEQRHFQYFHEIVKEFQLIYQKKQNIKFVIITTARVLSNEIYDKIHDRIADKFSSNVILFKKINPDLIGGIKIEYDGKIIDNTIKKQLKELININSQGEK